jgi:hypothetical protein
MDTQTIASNIAAQLDPDKARRWIDDHVNADLSEHPDVYRLALADKLTGDERAILERLIDHAQGRTVIETITPEIDAVMGTVLLHWQDNRLPVSRQTFFKILYTAESARTDRDDPDGWYQQAIRDIRQGDISYAALVEVFGEQWAADLFQAAGIQPGERPIRYRITYENDWRAQDARENNQDD